MTVIRLVFSASSIAVIDSSATCAGIKSVAGWYWYLVTLDSMYLMTFPASFIQINPCSFSSRWAFFFSF